MSRQIRNFFQMHMTFGRFFHLFFFCCQICFIFWGILFKKMYKSRYSKDVNEGCEVWLKTPKFSKPSLPLEVRMLVWHKDEPNITEGAEGQLASFLRRNPSECWTCPTCSEEGWSPLLMPLQQLRTLFCRAETTKPACYTQAAPGQ